MTNEEAYNKLLAERPVIVSVMLRDQHRYRYPESLADATAAHSDPPELVSLILQSAKHIYESELTPLAADLGKAPAKKSLSKPGRGSASRHEQKPAPGG